MRIDAKLVAQQAVLLDVYKRQDLILANKYVRGSHFPIIQETKLGYILAGNLPKHCRYKGPAVSFLARNNDGQILESLEKFWETETIPDNAPINNESACEEHFVKSTPVSYTHLDVYKRQQWLGFIKYALLLFNKTTRANSITLNISVLCGAMCVFVEETVYGKLKVKRTKLLKLFSYVMANCSQFSTYVGESNRPISRTFALNFIKSIKTNKLITLRFSVIS